MLELGDSKSDLVSGVGTFFRRDVGIDGFAEHEIDHAIHVGRINSRWLLHVHDAWPGVAAARPEDLPLTDMPNWLAKLSPGTLAESVLSEIGHRPTKIGEGLQDGFTDLAVRRLHLFGVEP